MEESKNIVNTTIMFDYKMRMSHLNDLNNNHLKYNYLGENYEYHAYVKLLEIIDSKIKLVDRNSKNVNFGNFGLDEYSSIHYYSDGVDVAEFDLLGIDEFCVYQWEITITDKSYGTKSKRIKVREELLQRLFPNKKVKTIIVSPETVKKYTKYERIYIEMPQYEESILRSRFTAESSSRKMLSLEEFSKMSKPFEYMNEIIKLSKAYYSDVKKLPDQLLVERIYDLDNLSNKKFKCFDIIKQQYMKIEVKYKKIYKNGEKVANRKKTFKEVVYLKNIVRGMGNVD